MSHHTTDPVGKEEEWKNFVKKFKEEYEGIDGDDGEKAEKFLIPLVVEYVSKVRENAVRESENKILHYVQYLETGAGEACVGSEGTDKRACEDATMWQHVGKKLKEFLSPDQKKEIINKSNCCNADMIVKGDDEGTMYYMCEKCAMPCDPKKEGWDMGSSRRTSR